MKTKQNIIRQINFLKKEKEKTNKKFLDGEIEYDFYAGKIQAIMELINDLERGLSNDK